MKFHTHTYGCQMNVRDSETVEALFVAAGHEKAAKRMGCHEIVTEDLNDGQLYCCMAWGWSDSWFETGGQFGIMSQVFNVSWQVVCT